MKRLPLAVDPEYTANRDRLVRRLCALAGSICTTEDARARTQLSALMAGLLMELLLQALGSMGRSPREIVVDIAKTLDRLEAEAPDDLPALLRLLGTEVPNGA